MDKHVNLSTLRGRDLLAVLADDTLLEVECFQKLPGKKVKNPELREERLSDKRRQVPDYRAEKLGG